GRLPPDIPESPQRAREARPLAAFPSLSASPGTLQGTAGPAPTPAAPPLLDPYAPPPGPRPIPVPVTMSPQAAPYPTARSRPPGTAAPPPAGGAWPVSPEPSRGFDARIFIAAGAVLVVVIAVAIAFFAGRATTASDAPATRPSSGAPPAAHPR